ncbi:MAG: (d)CMP kinase [Pyrinomonadaceae bacterium]
MSPLIIAIDGPAGSGKSTIGRMLAHVLNLVYVDTGSMYRAVALATIEAGIDPHDREAVTELVNHVRVDLVGQADALTVLMNDRDVTEQIRGDDVTYVSSIISIIPAVRRAMVARQREIGRRGAVLNGRDTTTVVFPDADFKFFLTAEPVERASRRFKEEQLALHPTTLNETLAEITERDERDSTRADSPLTIAEDAIVIDSTCLSVQEVFDAMMETITAGPK